MTIEKSTFWLDCDCSAKDTDVGLLSIDQAFASIFENTKTIERTEWVSLDHAFGRVLAAPIRARARSPQFDNSAMDGYAIFTKDLCGPAPWIIPVSGCQAAGDTGIEALPEKTAVQVFTGAMLPKGANAVVMQEKVTVNDRNIIIGKRPNVGDNIRRAGEDMKAGRIVLPVGRRLAAKDIAVAAAAGCAELLVIEKIRVVILSTGNELCGSGRVLERGKIWDVNSPMLRAALHDPKIEITKISHSYDRTSQLASELSHFQKTADLIITTGGISVSEADLVIPALHAIEGQVEFSGIALKPGKPLSFGKLDSCQWIGLPGNPVSAFATWIIFGQYIIDQLSGCFDNRNNTQYAVLKDELIHRVGRCELRLASFSGFDQNGRQVVDFLPQMRSAAVSHLAQADGFILIPSHIEHLPKSGLVEFIPF